MTENTIRHVPKWPDAAEPRGQFHVAPRDQLLAHPVIEQRTTGPAAGVQRRSIDHHPGADQAIGRRRLRPVVLLGESPAKLLHEARRLRLPVEHHPTTERPTVGMSAGERCGARQPVLLQQAVVVDECDPRGSRVPHAAESGVGQALERLEHASEAADPSETLMAVHDLSCVVGAVVVDHKHGPVGVGGDDLSADRHQCAVQQPGVVVGADDNVDR